MDPPKVFMVTILGSRVCNGQYRNLIKKLGLFFLLWGFRQCEASWQRHLQRNQGWVIRKGVTVTSHGAVSHQGVGVCWLQQYENSHILQFYTQRL